MSEKKPRGYSNRSEYTYQPGEEPDLGKEANETDLRKRFPRWEDGFEVADIQPEFPKIKSGV